jgi:sulfide:quinone oxidoreductase
VAGAEAVRELLPAFRAGTAIVGVCGAPFKCSPAPSETAFLLDEHLRACGARDDVRIQLVIPFGTPVPPSPATSEAILGRFAEHGIEFGRDRRVAGLDPATREAVLDDGTRLPFDLFLGVPVHRAPDVVVASGMTEDGWIPVDKHTLATRFPGVYAVGDVTSVGTPKAGVFAEGAVRVVADQLIARIRGESAPPGYDSTGACWMEFGDQQVARIDVDFLSTQGHPTGTFTPPSHLMAAKKVEFGSSHRARWFGRAAD